MHCGGSLERNVPLELPYRFDTSSTVKLILRGVAGLLSIVVAGALYSLLVSHDMKAAVLLLVITLIVLYFGRQFVRGLETSVGTIHPNEVVVEPVSVYGIRLRGPAGRFSLGRFQAVRVERIPPPVFAQGGPHERVALVGYQGTPNILVARTSDDEGLTLARDLAASLGLPYKEESAPY